ncbi:ATP synthase subunit e, mitochondrial [Mycena sanguinolenta]|uniref:ATP synthase F(0) complex subunit e, mitochondrial n=1 Tax=Mycena sanguinolenta TaxID=230812 RepID=A0A8H6XAP6_9AGAR|nr:ATP synthase subunit e, mitochondrial [Mycena sanguinolenta]
MGSPTVNVRTDTNFLILRRCLTAKLQVVRYTALFTGVVYGWYHRRTLQAAHDVHKIEAATHQREHLIAQAKEAWRKKQEAPKAAADTLVTDPEDPRFDLEKLIARWEANP